MSCCSSSFCWVNLKAKISFGSIILFVLAMSCSRCRLNVFMVSYGTLGHMHTVMYLITIIDNNCYCGPKPHRRHQILVVAKKFARGFVLVAFRCMQAAPPARVMRYIRQKKSHKNNSVRATTRCVGYELIKLNERSSALATGDQP